MNSLSRGLSLVATANRHRRLTNALNELDAVADATMVCDGPNTAEESPSFRTEIVVAREFKAVPPTVLETVADHGVRLTPQPPQGDRVVVWAR